MSALLVARRGVVAKPTAATVLRDDTFTGTVGTFLEGHTAEIGGQWTPSAAGSNRLSGTGTVYRDSAPPMYLMPTTIEVANYDVEYVLDVKTVIASDLLILAGRAVDGFNCYRAYITPTAVTMDKLVANAATTLGTPFSNTLTTGAHTLLLRMAGSQISVYFDSVLRIGPVSDSTFASAGKVGQRVGAAAVAQSPTTGIHGNRFRVLG